MALPRGLDLHCLRHAAQNVTDGRYTDVTLIDLRGVLDKLPLLPLDPSRPTAEPLAATGTDGKTDPDARFTVCCAVCSPADESSTSGAIVDKRSRNIELSAVAVTDAADNACAPLSIVGQLRAQGLEPWTHGLKGRCSTD